MMGGSNIITDIRSRCGMEDKRFQNQISGVKRRRQYCTRTPLPQTSVMALVIALLRTLHLTSSLMLPIGRGNPNFHLMKNFQSQIFPTSHPKHQSSTGRTDSLLRVSTNEGVSQMEASEGKESSGSDASMISTSSIPIDDLQELGWQDYFSNQIFLGDEKLEMSLETSLKASNRIPLRVTEVRSKTIHAVGAHGIDWGIPITPGQKIRNDNEEKVVVAGDWILVEPEDSIQIDPTTCVEANSYSPPRIRRILQRNSVLKRRAPGRNKRQAQLIAANLDTVFVVSSCNQDFNVARLERYIAMVLETENVMPVIVLTKKDLLEQGDDDDDDDDDDFLDIDSDMMDDDDDDMDLSSSWLLDYYLEEATSIAGGSIPVVCLDARDRDQAMTLLAPWLGPGQTVAFVGSSGVGKSTLANTLCNREVAATGDIHIDSGQGRHTTTRRQLHFIRQHNSERNNGAILDTPGLRELQLVDASQGLNLVFSDLVELSKECKFKDCKHEGEPGCAIAHAVEQGDLDPYRVARWEKLVAEEKRNSDEVAEGKKERERKKRLRQKNLKRRNQN